MQPDPALPDLRLPVARALSWADQPGLDSLDALGLAMLERSYGLGLANDPRAIFEQGVAGYRQDGFGDVAGTLELFRRIYDPGAVLDAHYLSLAWGYDRSTLEALYCDSVAPPGDYRDRLMASLELGGYETTHVLFAGLFLRSNRCAGYLSPQDADLIAQRVLAVLDLEDGRLDDLDIEVMAMLAADGRIDLVPWPAREALLNAQQADGSWAASTRLDGSGGPQPGFAHSTLIALWFLLAWQAGDGFVPLAPPALD